MVSGRSGRPRAYRQCREWLGELPDGSRTCVLIGAAYILVGTGAVKETGKSYGNLRIDRRWSSSVGTACEPASEAGERRGSWGRLRRAPRLTGRPAGRPESEATLRGRVGREGRASCAFRVVIHPGRSRQVLGSFAEGPKVTELRKSVWRWSSSVGTACEPATDW